MTIHPNIILSFWFGNDVHAPKSDLAYIQSRIPFWFGRNEEFEQKQKDLKDVIDQVREWESNPADEETMRAWNNPRGYLARIILFDQFPRSVYRASSKAFEYDPIAVKYSLKIVDENLWDQFAATERLFAIVSIQHSENIELQRKGVQLASIVAAGESEDVVSFFKNLKGFPMEHHDVIEIFGRFPGRNDVLVSYH